VLKRLRIERFKSIYEEDIEFGAVNLFVGANGAGKSNVLEALGVLSAALSKGLEPTTLDLRGVRLSLPNLFKSSFKNHDLPKTFRLEAEFENGRYECSIRASGKSQFLEFFSEALYDGHRQVFGRSNHGIKLHGAADQVPGFDRSLVETSRSVWSIIGPVTTISAGLRRELDDFSRFAIYAPQTAIMRGLAVDSRVVEPLGLTGSGLAAAFRDIQDAGATEFDQILKIIWEPGWSAAVSTGSYNSDVVPSQVRSEGLLLYFRDKYMQARRSELSAYDASEGTLYLLFVATLLAHPSTPETFALDNVDGTLNPSLVRKLTDHVVNVVRSDADGHRQVFMTSHHPSSLDSFDIFDPGQKIFICYRRQRSEAVPGSTSIRQLEPPPEMTKADWVIKNRGRNLSELLLTERIPDAL
jgi:predicted ATPase